MAKKRLCPECNEPLTQGHRKDRCRDEDFPKVYRASHNKVHTLSKYNNKEFERIEFDGGFMMVFSGAQVLKGKYTQALINAQTIIQKRV